MSCPFPDHALQRSGLMQGICLIKSLLLCVLLASSGLVHAEEEDDAEEFEQPVQELFQSTLVYPQEQKELGINLSPRFHKGQEEDQWILPVGIEYGITDAFQVGLEWEVYKHLDPDDESSEQGIGDAEVEAQYSWMSISGQPVHAALGVGVLIPTGDEDKDLGEGSVAVEPVAILAADLDALNGGQVFLNVGAEIDKDQTEKFVNIGAFMALDDWVPSLEWNWSEEEEERYLTPGLSWNSQGPWSVGLGVPVGLEDDADDYRVIMQFIYEAMVD
jgi:hypothetical protein